MLTSFDLKGEPFRDEKKLGPGKKSFVVTLMLQSRERTLTGNEADDVCKRDRRSLHESNHGATLRA